MDDEYVRNIFVSFAGCNELAAGIPSDKAMRSFERSPKLFKQTFRNVVWSEHNGKKTSAFEIDLERVERTMHKISAVIYFDRNRRKITWDTCAIIKQMVGSDFRGGESDSLFEMMESQNLPWFGDNPRVFKYQVIEPPNLPATFRFLFYEGVDVIVAPFLDQPKNQEA